MKIEMNSQEFLGLLSGEATAELKEKIAGMMLATVDSPELQEAIEKRVTKKAEQRMEVVLDKAIIHNSSWNKNDIQGWGAQIIKEQFREHFRQQHHFETIMKKLINEQLTVLFNEAIEDFLKEELKKTINGDLMEAYAKSIANVDFGKMIREEVQRRFKSVLNQEG